MDTSKQAARQRFILSPDATFPAYVDVADLPNFPGWIDCTDMAPEEFQKLVAEKLAVRPYIVGLAM
jgi:hypothetical protein